MFIFLIYSVSRVLVLTHTKVNLMKKVVSCLLIVLPFLIAGCGGGSDSYVTASSRSFSPIQATGSDGSEVPLYWKYEVNNGSTILAELPGGSAIGIDFDHILVNIDSSGQARTVSADGLLSGFVNGVAFNGSVNLSDKELLEKSDTRTLINSTDLKLNLVVKAQGETAAIGITANAQMSTPIEWFLDNDSLESLGVGYVQNETSLGTVTGSLDITGIDKESFSEDISSSDSWAIMEYKATATVNGKTYNNVVVVERITEIPDVSNGFVKMDTVTITYWVAKGVGMIKGVGFFDILGQRVDVELIETNLEQVDNAVLGNTESDLAAISGVWRWDSKVEYPGDEGYTTFDQSGAIITYDYTGDTYDQGADCYEVENTASDMKQLNDHSVQYTDAESQMMVTVEYVLFDNNTRMEYAAKDMNGSVLETGVMVKVDEVNINNLSMCQ